jgi:CBS domain-containing protein
MKVKKLMKQDVGYCSSDDNLTKAAEIMRLKDCGAVPVVDDDEKLIGIVTDRDICLAVGAADKKPSEIKTGEIIKKRIVACAADDRIEIALKKMKQRQVKRLPVLDGNKKLVGILSITDFLISPKKDKSVRKKVYSALKAIGKPKPIVLKEIEI